MREQLGLTCTEINKYGKIESLNIADPNQQQMLNGKCRHTINVTPFNNRNRIFYLRPYYFVSQYFYLFMTSIFYFILFSADSITCILFFLFKRFSVLLLLLYFTFTHAYVRFYCFRSLLLIQIYVSPINLPSNLSTHFCQSVCHQKRTGHLSSLNQCINMKRVRVRGWR